MPDLLLQAGAVALGGAVGGVARVWLSVVLTARFGAVLPVGTLVVNVTGAVALGWLAALPAAGVAWLLLAVGALGSYTTVSTFAIETLGLWDEGRGLAAAAYAALSLGLCLGGAALGLGLGGGFGWAG
mgnify:CR=1 FL=1